MRKEIVMLQDLMKIHDFDAYLVETSDFHQSEYVGEYFKCRAFLSGFTGSAGTLLVTQNSAYLWTDGRYFIQAENQLKDSGITLMKMGQAGVLTLEEQMASLFDDKFTFACDGRTVSYSKLQGLKERFPSMNIVLNQDLVNEIWNNRPSLSCEKVFDYNVKYCGETRTSKINRIREKMEEFNAESHLITSLDDIAWILNLRGHDVACNPVMLSYLVMTKTNCTLYCQLQAVDENLKEILEEDGVSLRDYYCISEDLKLLDEGPLLVDQTKVNAFLISCLPKSIGRIFKPNPSTLMKSIKNSVEIKNTKIAHIKDGVAVTKFMIWIKEEIQKRSITECEASDMLESFRRQQEHYLEPSFETIAAYGKNAAMMHYSAKPHQQATLENKNLFLVDSGGQYLEGTTDITRTFALGDVDDLQKNHFTLALRSMLALQNAHFLYGCIGLNLDILARGPLWDENLDYQCGTGHGVGHLLNVHEGPNGFRWRMMPGRNESAILEEGMITTDEPGVYIPNSHGIRHENELLCVKGEENEYGQFMHFEVITFAPIDLDAIDESLLSFREKQWLNHYHQQVREVISPYLTEQEKVMLEKYTREI